LYTHSVIQKQGASVEEELQQLHVCNNSMFSLLVLYLNVLPLEKVRYPGLSVGFSEASQNHSFCQRLRCLGVDLCLWLGDNGVALSMVKRAQYSNNV